MRFRLRYLQHNLELSEGEFTIGRSAECQLSLDDPLVSRRHAMLVVTKGGVTVTDLGSRNGVLVNGARIAAPTPLTPGDKVLVGSQELTLLVGREGGALETTSVQVGKNIPTLLDVRDAADPTAWTASGVRAPNAPNEGTVRPPPDTSSSESTDPSIERRADVFDLLGRVAEKALALGRADEAERLLTTALADVAEASRAGRRLSPALLENAGRFAARLATATSKGGWVDYVIELYDLQGRPCPATVIDELYSALRKVSAVDLARLRTYVSHLRDRQSTLGPAERFLLQRLEGLERLAALR